MTQKEYDKQMQLLEDEYKKAKRNLMRRCATENSPHRIGDIVTDHIGSIKIESMVPGASFYKLPCMVYIGKELKKNLEPRKSRATRGVWQTNLLK